MKVVFRIDEREPNRVALHDGDRARRESVDLLAVEDAALREVFLEKWQHGRLLFDEERHRRDRDVSRARCRPVCGGAAQAPAHATTKMAAERTSVSLTMVSKACLV